MSRGTEDSHDVSIDMMKNLGFPPNVGFGWWWREGDPGQEVVYFVDADRETVWANDMKGTWERVADNEKISRVMAEYNEAKRIRDSGSNMKVA